MNATNVEPFRRSGKYSGVYAIIDASGVTFRASMINQQIYSLVSDNLTVNLYCVNLSVYSLLQTEMVPLNKLTDFELSDMLKADSELVFRLLYERYWDKLYVIAKKRLGDNEEAEEVVQDVFCNLWRRRLNLNLTKGFDNYFAVAVKFEVINRMAKHAKATAYEKEAALALSEIDQSTIQQLDYNELLRQFEQTVNALPEKCRIVFKLQHEKGYTQQQIADELEISTKTVEAHLSKARKTLRGTFGNLLGLML
jgi:RNA polymerase sigma-70 factor (ECF subfamily)